MTQKHEPPKRLDTVFLTGPGGMVYEFPREVAAKHLLSIDRAAALGHLPITPYGSIPSAPAQMTHTEETADVEGRHLAWNPAFGWVWHSNYLFGTFLWVDGFYYTGYHYHPYGTELAHV